MFGVGPEENFGGGNVSVRRVGGTDQAAGTEGGGALRDCSFEYE